MLKSCGVHINVAIGCGNRFQKIRGILRRNNMQHVIINLNNSVFILCVFKVCDSVIFIYLEHIVEEMSSDIFLLSYLVELVREFQAVGEHDSDRAIPVNISFVSDAISSEGFFREIHDLLWTTATLDWHLRQHKDSIATFEVFSNLRSLVGIIHHVDGANRRIRVLESIHRSLNFIISQCQAWSCDKVIVGNLISFLSLKCIVFRVDLCNRFMSQVKPFHHDIGLLSHHVFLFFLLSLFTNNHHRIRHILILLTRCPGHHHQSW